MIFLVVAMRPGPVITAAPVEQLPISSHSAWSAVDAKIAALLDNITRGTRDLVEERLDTLRHERDRLRLRADELDALAAEEREVQSMVGDAGRFLAGLAATFKHGEPAERTTAIRQCVNRIVVDKPRGEVSISLRAVPGVAASGAATELDVTARFVPPSQPVAPSPSAGRERPAKRATRASAAASPRARR